MSAAALILLLLAQDPGRDPVTALVGRLGDERLAVRDQASAKLVELGEAALAPLRRILRTTDDPEVKVRATDVLLRIEMWLPKCRTVRDLGATRAFETGANAWIDVEVKPIGVEAGLQKEALRLIRAGRFEEINKRPHQMLPVVINSLASDEEALASAAHEALYKYCEHLGLRNKAGMNPVSLVWIWSAQYRASEFGLWTKKWRKLNEIRCVGWIGKDIDTVDWESLAAKLKGGGEYDDETRPQGIAFQVVKRFGKAAWPKLANYLDHEDIGIAQGAAAALIELTGEKKPLPKDSDKAAVKKAWLEWIATH